YGLDRGPPLGSHERRPDLDVVYRTAISDPVRRLGLHRRHLHVRNGLLLCRPDTWRTRPRGHAAPRPRQPSHVP
ncbi:hypothetical protein BVRB_040100, partial [Beta vulgaris subsp. vulgaris]